PALRAALARADPEVRAAAGQSIARALIERAARESMEERDAAAGEIVRIGEPALLALIESLDGASGDAARLARSCLLGILARSTVLPRPGPVDPLRLSGLVQDLTHEIAVTRALTALEIGRLGRRGILHQPGEPER